MPDEITAADVLQAERDVKYIASFCRGLLALAPVLEEADPAARLVREMERAAEEAKARTGEAALRLDDATAAIGAAEAEATRIITEAEAARASAAKTVEEAVAFGAEAESAAQKILADARDESARLIAAGSAEARALVRAVEGEIAALKERQGEEEERHARLKAACEAEESRLAALKQELERFRAAAAKL